jgi:hypothetical protein
MNISFLFGCSTETDPKIYSKNLPKLDIKNYFNGEVEAHGIIQDRGGKVIKTFTVKMNGIWNNNEGKIAEDFVFSDGKTDRRIWEINMIDDNNFTSKAHDTIGFGSGKQYGNTMRMNYVLRIDFDGKKYDVSMSDWIYLIDEKNAVNICKMTKFGFRVGTLVVSFKKL